MLIIFLFFFVGIFQYYYFENRENYKAVTQYVLNKENILRDVTKVFVKKSSSYGYNYYFQKLDSDFNEVIEFKNIKELENEKSVKYFWILLGHEDNLLVSDWEKEMEKYNFQLLGKNIFLALELYYIIILIIKIKLLLIV